MLDFRIDTFIAVCKYLNFTKAAEVLNITQPAVSQHIRYLQESYGVELFEHTGKKISLTKEGELLFSIATTLKHDDIFLRSRLQEGKLQRRTVVFGSTLTVGQYVIMDKMAKYMKQHPHTSLKMEIANTKQLLEGIDKGLIDFAMVEGYFPKNEYDYLVYSKEPYVAICSKNHPLASKTVTIEQVFEEAVILREEGSGSRDILERYLQERNYSIHDFHQCSEINNIQAIINLVKEGCGITFLYRAAIQEELQSGVVQEINIEDFHLLHDITFLWRKNSVFAKEYRALFQELSRL